MAGSPLSVVAVISEEAGFVTMVSLGPLLFVLTVETFLLRPGGQLIANSWAPGIGGGRKEDDGEGNWDDTTR